MGKKDKLLAKLLSKPKDFTFNELETLLEYLGFYLDNVGKTSGSRVRFVNDELRIVIKLHKPHHQKVLLPYQIKEVISKLEKGGII
ncbi:type II toxin-antitoxin system HicA family toxin [Ligilactobacillus salivarius]|uniref:Toxin HicA n=2 Tax=Ligilactobacillus salivarius TaxID=1624 RepID=A0A1V9RC25_9LACO|nr:type II toxin-antitoxin system HicA family toxin [Ligilactobacillus salivarius]PEH10402.1 type II toxin-antitoxin system HicA family toxin [Lactobacillus sp. UMNPBX2]MBZ4030986.1 type II toxin-antitoxin system HicA family toxin [Ligilactobacillus salivarius]MCI6062298.1 type II toxin-antitoxin system HicA family toxin [Ligilactobacillus salivarius]MDM8283466.1 type II toxin-antitoxin system HicA family toxin [Ligilactobacillus salivarius]MDY5246608.1 type II toxin-antitoxin system HicA fami